MNRCAGTTGPDAGVLGLVLAEVDRLWRPLGRPSESARG